MDVKDGDGDEMAQADADRLSPMAEASPETPPIPSNVSADLIELLRVMPRVFRGLRRRGTESDESTWSKSALSALFKRGGLGPRHIPVVIVLVLEGPFTVGELADRLRLNLATVSLMVGELARAGLVERREDEQDRRRVLVSIPEQHCQRLAPFVNERIAPLRRALDRMSPELRQAFLTGWQLLAEEIERSSRPDD